MYYGAKGLEILGMTMIGIGFIIKFPRLMDPKLLLAGIVCFCGRLGNRKIHPTVNFIPFILIFISKLII